MKLHKLTYMYMYFGNLDFFNAMVYFYSCIEKLRVY